MWGFCFAAYWFSRAERLAQFTGQEGAGKGPRVSRGRRRLSRPAASGLIPGRTWRIPYDAGRKAA